MSEKKLNREARQLIANRAHHRCEYCQSLRKYASQSFEMEHIFPQSLGGKTNPENLAYACGGCNRRKYNKTTATDPVSSKSVPLFHPREHNWRDHFGWNEDYSLVIGITPTGRATIEALQLNREGLVNMRNLLRSAGFHPPTNP